MKLLTYEKYASSKLNDHDCLALEIQLKISWQLKL